MIVADIPFEFLRQHALMSWQDIKFGLDHQFIKPKVAIDKAIEMLSTIENNAIEEIELAGLSESDSVTKLVNQLAAKEVNQNDCIKSKWLYLLLEWFFVNKLFINDPLGGVEKIYDDFDYPEEITAFVRYMPMVGEDLGSKELNEARLYEYWNVYLGDARKKFKPH
ncbi:MAG: DUF2247 family protein [Kiritimatiellae bacterium]|nr:DUF2247 family protein [Kiritimatiellia bacterium]